jgi:hypothetical protein
VDWYWKAAGLVAIAWGVARALGVYGEAERELDLPFLYGFLLTLGGWGAVFFVIDRIAKFVGWNRPPATSEEPVPVEIAAPDAPDAPDPSVSDRAPASSRTTARRKGRAPSKR